MKPGLLLFREDDHITIISTACKNALKTVMVNMLAFAERCHHQALELWLRWMA